MLHRIIAERALWKERGKSGGSKAAVAARRTGHGGRGDLAGGSIKPRQKAASGPRGLAWALRPAPDLTLPAAA